MTRALVLAGGGVAGVAWELGVLRGVGEANPDLAAALVAADRVIGTSAGSAVAAQITSGTDLDTLYRAQLDTESSEIFVELDIEQLLRDMDRVTAGVTDGDEARRRIAAFALEAPTVDEATRKAVIAARLPRPDWPDRDLTVTAVDASTGELTLFTRDSGVDLVDAVAASCAVPGIWPPVTIGSQRYVDGGVSSATNAGLAAGCDPVLVLTPLPAAAPPPLNRLAAELDLLAPADTLAVYADADSVAAFGTNPLDPATRPAAARAGRAVGRAHADRIADLWR